MKHRPAKDSYHLLDRHELVFDKRHIHDTHKTHSIGLMHTCIQCSSCPHHCNYHVAQNKKLKTYIVQWCKSTKQKNKKQEMFVKHNAPKAIFVTVVLYNWISLFKISFTKLMYEEEIHFGKLLSQQSEMVLEHLSLMTFPFDPVTPKSLAFLCYPRRMCGPSLKKVG